MTGLQDATVILGRMKKNALYKAGVLESKDERVERNDGSPIVSRDAAVFLASDL